MKKHIQVIPRIRIISENEEERRYTENMILKGRCRKLRIRIHSQKIRILVVQRILYNIFRVITRKNQCKKINAFNQWMIRNGSAQNNTCKCTIAHHYVHKHKLLNG